MEWIKIIWKHEYSDEPYEILMELSDNRMTVRKIEFFKDGKIGYAIGDLEINGTGLNEEVFPSIDEYNRLNMIYKNPNDKEELLAENISVSEFESLWIKTLN